MSVKIVQGDLLEAFANKEIETIAHACNCFHTMGKGIAKRIADAYPEAFEADKATLCGDRDKLGAISKAKLDNNSYIFNLYTQYKYGLQTRHTMYDAVVSSLEQVERFMSIFHCKSIGLPYKMGCNNGGGDWRVVLPIIESVFEEANYLDVRIYQIS